LTGSLAGHKAHPESDVDIELYVRDPSVLLGSDTWYRQFGDVLVVEELDNPGWHPTRLVYYADGKIDFMVAPADVLRGGVRYDRPFVVLLDKDGMAPALRLAASDEAPPSLSDFTRCVNWFYAGTIAWAKCLARSEPWAAKVRDWDTKVQMLSMIEWDHKVRHGWDYETWFGGTHLHEWMDPDIVAAVAHCWSGFSLGDSLRALRASLELFERLSVRTAVALGFAPFDATGVRRRIDDLVSRAGDDRLNARRDVTAGPGA
jgi:aminoglycoside 6-adenylyltransferase